MTAPGPEDALRTLAAELREEDTVISPYVVDSADEPALGLLVASQPRAAGDPSTYSLLVESIREGYLLHYEAPRLLAGHDPDLALLAGDYLYANGLSRLAALGDLDAVRELSDLISLSAQLHADHPSGAESLAAALWMAAADAIGSGSGDGYEQAKQAVRSGAEEGPDLLNTAGLAAQERADGKRFARAAGAIGFAIPLG